MIRIVAILAAYNEERFIAGCLEHLFAQGVEAYLIDNSSTDRTVEIAERYLGRGLAGIENFPRTKDTYTWEPILRRKEDLAATLEADWFMHADPDEIRLPPRSDVTLADAFAEVEDKGYNAVNFVEFTFVPTREAPDHDHPDFQRTMRYCYPFTGDFPHQVKAWKRQPKRVDLARSGGHRVRFPDQRLYPESFKMRHYPYLSAAHIVGKYVGKKYAADEVRKGWHGYRTQITVEKIELPAQDELNVYVSDDALDLSNPRTKHIWQDWAQPEEKKVDPPIESIPPGKPTGKGTTASSQTAVESGEAKTANAGVGRWKNKVRGIGHSLSVRRSIAASRHKILRALGNPPNVTFITGRGNIGDHLIHAGARQLLSGIDYREANIWRNREGQLRGLGGLRGHTALLTGGGGWCEPFHRMWPTVLSLLEKRFEKVIVLPSTVDTSFDPVKQVLSRTNALFFARERESYRQLQGLCKTDLAHDTAFFFDFGPYKNHSEGLLKAYRTDGESAHGGRTPPGNDDISLSCDTLDEWLWRIAHHEVIETDRAHVMIAAAMLGKKVRYRATNYHKVPAIADYSLKGLRVERNPEDPLGLDEPSVATPRVTTEAPEEQATRSSAGPSGKDVPPSPFVVGVGRSGTTLLRLMLDSHPDLTMPPETHFIPQVALACERAREGSRDPRKAFMRVVTTSHTWGYHRLEENQLRRRINAIDPFDLGKALRVFYGLYAERFGKARWGDKTPLYVRQMDLIAKVLPEARFVHLIRDGRDVALSHEGLWFGPNSVEEAAHLWRSWIEEARYQARNLGDSYLEIRYEDLVTDTKSTLKQVADFVDLPWAPEMLDYHERAKDRMSEIDKDVLGPDGEVIVGGEERKAIHVLTSKPPQKSRIGRWRTEMSDQDRECFEQIAGEMLRSLGYETR